MVIEQDLKKFIKTYMERAKNIMTCSECKYKHRSIVDLKVCDKCGNEINGNSKAKILFMEMADEWVKLYVKAGISESKAQMRVIKLLETLPIIPTSIVRFIEVHFEDF